MKVELPEPDGYFQGNAFYLKTTVLNIIEKATGTEVSESPKTADKQTPQHQEAMMQRGEVPQPVEANRTHVHKGADGNWTCGGE